MRLVKIVMCLHNTGVDLEFIFLEIFIFHDNEENTSQENK